LLVARLSMGRPATVDLVSLALAVVGAWSVVYQLVPGGNPTLAGVVAVVVALTLVWFRLARRPQDLFTAAARSEGRADALRRAMVDGMTHDFAYENLARLYAPIVADIGLPHVCWPVDVSGKQCLVVTIAPLAPQRLDSIIAGVETPRDAAWTERVSRFAPERQEFMAMTRRSVSSANKFGDEAGDEAGENVVLAAISADPDLTMTVNTASYGQIMRTSDSLVTEFAAFADLAHRSAFRKKPRPLMFADGDLLKVLPWRRRVHSWDDRTTLLVAPRGRASGLGVSLALVEEREGKATAFVARRSSSVGTYPEVLHVVPSGMMNTRGAAADDLAPLPRLTMLSEFLEECFDIAELSGPSVGSFAKRVDEKLHEFRLVDLEPEFTGLAIDLLNLRTEVCGVLDLTGHRSVVDAFTLSWEYTERLHRIDLDTATPAVRRADFVQTGVGSLQLAARWIAARRASTPGPA
jgi:hypothetical protein